MQSWINIPAIFNATFGLYEGVIQVQQANTVIKYKVTAYDDSRNYIIEDNNGQYYIRKPINHSLINIYNSHNGSDNPIMEEKNS